MLPVFRTYISIWLFLLSEFAYFSISRLKSLKRVLAQCLRPQDRSNVRLPFARQSMSRSFCSAPPASSCPGNTSMRQESALTVRHHDSAQARPKSTCDVCEGWPGEVHTAPAPCARPPLRNNSQTAQTKDLHPAPRGKAARPEKATAPSPATTVLQTKSSSSFPVTLFSSVHHSTQAISPLTSDGINPDLSWIRSAAVGQWSTAPPDCFCMWLDESLPNFHRPPRDRDVLPPGHRRLAHEGRLQRRRPELGLEPARLIQKLQAPRAELRQYFLKFSEV